MHVKDKGEENAEDFVTNLLSEKVKARCFHLTRSRRKKLRGQWQTVHEDLFPGYVFIDTVQPEKILRELKKAPGPRLLFSDDEYVSTLERYESDFMEQIADKNGVIGISTVNIEKDGTVTYLSGPLVHIKDQVKKINLHKRIAEIQASFLGHSQTVYLGIEIKDLRG